MTLAVQCKRYFVPIRYVPVTITLKINRRSFFRGSHGFIVGHIAPEAQAGGPIAWVEEGDSIDIDATTNSITLQVSDEVLQARQARWETLLKSHARHIVSIYSDGIIVCKRLYYRWLINSGWQIMVTSHAINQSDGMTRNGLTEKCFTDSTKPLR